jgi:hypothetical protein
MNDDIAVAKGFARCSSLGALGVERMLCAVDSRSVAQCSYAGSFEFFVGSQITGSEMLVFWDASAMVEEAWSLNWQKRNEAGRKGS